MNGKRDITERIEKFRKRIDEGGRAPDMDEHVEAAMDALDRIDPKGGRTQSAVTRIRGALEKIRAADGRPSGRTARIVRSKLESAENDLVKGGARSNRGGVGSVLTHVGRILDALSGGDKGLGESSADLTTVKRKIDQAITAFENQRPDYEVIDIIEDALDAFHQLKNGGKLERTYSAVEDALDQLRHGGDESLMLLRDAAYDLESMVESSPTVIESTLRIDDELPTLPDEVRGERDAREAKDFFDALKRKIDDDSLSLDSFSKGRTSGAEAVRTASRTWGYIADQLGEGGQWGPVVDGTHIDQVADAMTSRKLAELMRQAFGADAYDRFQDEFVAPALDDLERYRP